VQDASLPVLQERQGLCNIPWNCTVPPNAGAGPPCHLKYECSCPHGIWWAIMLAQPLLYASWASSKPWGLLAIGLYLSGTLLECKATLHSPVVQFLFPWSFIRASMQITFQSNLYEGMYWTDMHSIFCYPHRKIMNAMRQTGLLIRDLVTSDIFDNMLPASSIKVTANCCSMSLTMQGRQPVRRPQDQRHTQTEGMHAWLRNGRTYRQKWWLVD